MELMFTAIIPCRGIRAWGIGNGNPYNIKNNTCNTTLYVIAFVDHSSPEKFKTRIELIDIMPTPTDVLQVYKNPTQNLEIVLLKINTSCNKTHVQNSLQAE